MSQPQADTTPPFDLLIYHHYHRSTHIVDSWFYVNEEITYEGWTKRVRPGLNRIAPLFVDNRRGVTQLPYGLRLRWIMPENSRHSDQTRLKISLVEGIVSQALFIIPNEGRLIEDKHVDSGRDIYALARKYKMPWQTPLSPVS